MNTTKKISYDDTRDCAIRIIDKLIDLGLLDDNDDHYFDIQDTIQDEYNNLLGLDIDDQFEGFFTMEKFARKCTITGQGMNEGWYCEGLDTYIKTEADAINFVNQHTYADLECAYNDEFIYYTEWDSEEEIQ